MPYTTLFFDLDDTLYPPSTGLWEAIRQRMTSYMIEKLGLPLDQIESMRQSYLEKYGTTLRGLQHFYQVDTEEYLHYVHNLPLAEFIQPDPALREMILSLPQKRWIFTNADAAHAHRVIDVLDLKGCFEGIIDVRAIGFLNKPEPEAYRRALAIAGETTPSNCILLDDALRNLLPAKDLGFLTVLVHPKPNGTLNGGGAHYDIPHLRDLPKILPDLWVDRESSRAR